MRWVVVYPRSWIGEQRDAFCFGFENDSGEDLFTLLFEANVVTPTQLAKQFGLSFEELMRVWSEMPMDNAAIAAEMKPTRAARQSFSWIVVWDFGTKIRPANECV
jgi:hypothetical protein